MTTDEPNAPGGWSWIEYAVRTADGYIDDHPNDLDEAVAEAERCRRVAAGDSRWAGQCKGAEVVSRRITATAWHEWPLDNNQEHEPRRPSPGPMSTPSGPYGAERGDGPPRWCPARPDRDAVTLTCQHPGGEGHGGEHWATGSLGVFRWSDPVDSDRQAERLCVVCKGPSERPFCADCMAEANRVVDAEDADGSDRS